jgi:hypothetical protein
MVSLSPVGCGSLECGLEERRVTLVYPISDICVTIEYVMGILVKQTVRADSDTSIPSAHDHKCLRRGGYQVTEGAE